MPKPTVLIVDDKKVNRQILRLIFAEEYFLLEAENGEAALKILEQNPVDLMILDLVMPVMNGFEVLEKIKTLPQNQQIPVVVNTEFGEESNEIRALDLGAADFITKPYNRRIVQARVRNIMQKTVLERRQLKQNLNETTLRMQALADTIPGGIAIFDLRHPGLRYYNDSFCAISGRTRSEYIEATKEDCFALVYEEDRPLLMQTFLRARRDSGPIKVSYRVHKKGGGMAWIGLSAVCYKKEEGVPVYHAVLVDQTEEKELMNLRTRVMEKLEYDAEHDKLTGVYNREGFCKRAEKILREHSNEKYYIICWDIRNFKIINERFGNKKGDEVLVAFAQKLKKLSGKEELCGRLTGDRFACCLRRDHVCIDQLEKEVGMWDTQSELGCRFSVYFGVYLIENLGLPVELMCDRATMALKSVKGSSMRRSAIYNEKMLNHLQKEQEIESEMYTALKSRQFVIYMQPIYSITTGLPISAEALVRWQHPQKGIISPGEFIPLFERNGFITLLDAYVWEEVCQFLSRRIAKGQRVVPISVNISRLNVENKHLALELRSLIDRYGLKPAMLKLEITESAYMDDPKKLKEAVVSLQKQGFTVLMDDFGSGYSSLNMLKDVPVDYLKIDMRFLADLETSARAGNVLNSVVHMAKWLKMEVIAEGVETQQQVDFLRGIGCDKIQGYFYSRPLPRQDFCALLEEGKEKLAAQQEICLDDYDFDSVWNASKESSLLFNGIVGAMGIYELHENRLEALRVNDGYFELFGGSPQEFFQNGYNGFERLYEEDKKALLEICKEAEKQGRPMQAILRRPHLDGRCLICDVRLRYLGKNGSRSVFCLTAFDVTTQQENQQARYLQQYLAVLSNLYTDIIELNFTDNTRKTIFSTDEQAEGRVENLAEAYERMEYSRIHPDDREAYCRFFTVEALEEELERNQNGFITAEARVLGKDGVYHWRRRVILPLGNQQGKKVFLSCLATIDAQKQAEELLEEAAALEAVKWERERYLEVIKQTDTIVFEWDFDQRTFHAEKGYEQFALADEDPWQVAKNGVTAKVVHPDDLPVVNAFFEGACKNDAKNANQMEIRLKTKDGQYHWCCITSNAQKGENQEWKRVIATINLIDRRKQAEQNAQESETMLGDIIKNLPVGIIVAECGHEIMPKFISRKAAEILGCRAAKPADCMMRETCPLASLWKRTLRQAAEKRSEENSELWHFEEQFFIHENPQKPQWAQVEGVMRRNGEGKIFAYCAITNVTELHNTRSALQKTTEELQHLLDQLPVGVGIYELAQRQIIIKYLNERAYEIFDMKRPEPQNGENALVKQYPQGHLRQLEEWMKKTPQQISTDDVVRAQKSDGRFFWLRNIATILELPGQNPVCYAVMSDITDQEEMEREYRRQNELYTLLLRNSDMQIMDYDTQEKKLTYSLKNSRGERIKRTVENLDAISLADSKILHPDFLHICTDMVCTASQKIMSGEVEYRADFWGAGYRWYRTSFISIADKQGQVYRVIGMGEDITREKQLQDHLNREQNYRQAVMMETLFAMETDMTAENTKVIHISEHGKEYYPPLDYFSRGGGRHLHPDDRDRVLSIFSVQNMQKAMQRGNTEIRTQFRMEKRDGSWVWVETVAYLLYEAEEKSPRALVYIRLAQKERELIERAEIDPVTKIYNRATLQEKIETTLDSGEEKVAFALCDIDDFKKINDTKGHRKGDETLARLAKLLSENFRRKDIIGRLGGDEFVVLLRNVNRAADVEKKMENLLSQIRGIEGEDAFSISVGIAIREKEHEHFESLYERADRALYQAKKDGKDQFIIES